MREPADYPDEIERDATLPAGSGERGPAPERAQLRDLTIPQRGVFVVGRAFFT